MSKDNLVRAGILRFMEKRGLKATPWAARAGINESTFRSFLDGTAQSPRYDTLAKLAEAEGVSVAEMVGEKQRPGRAIAKSPDGEFTSIGRFDVTFSMGPGALIADHPEPLGYWLIETQWLNGLTRAASEHLAIVRADGDSMVPTLHAGDWVLIDRTQKRITREGIYAIRVGDDVWIKRLSLNLKTKAVRVISDNPTTPVQEVEEFDVEIIGRVICMVARKM